MHFSRYDHNPTNDKCMKKITNYKKIIIQYTKSNENAGRRNVVRISYRFSPNNMVQSHSTGGAACLRGWMENGAIIFRHLCSKLRFCVPQSKKVPQTLNWFAIVFVIHKRKVMRVCGVKLYKKKKTIFNYKRYTRNSQPLGSKIHFENTYCPREKWLPQHRNKK